MAEAVMRLAAERSLAETCVGSLQRHMAPPDIEAARDMLAAAGNGVIVLTSPTAPEKSRERPAWQDGGFIMAAF